MRRPRGKEISARATKFSFLNAAEEERSGRDRASAAYRAFVLASPSTIAGMEKA
jgi:hypothetical protein